MRSQRQILDVCWLAGDVSNAEVLQRSGLLTIGDTLRYRCYSLFGHVARLDPGVPAHDALRLMVDTYGGSWRNPPSRPRGNSGSTRFRRMPTLYCYLRRGDMSSPWVTERRNGLLGLRDDDNDDEGCKTLSKMEGNINFIKAPTGCPELGLLSV